MEISPVFLPLIGLLLALWTGAAIFLMIKASRQIRSARAHRNAARRLARMVEDGPAIALLVRADGRIEAPDRFARWIGLDTVPEYLTELSRADGTGLSEEQVEELSTHVRRTQKTARPFKMALRPIGSRK